VKLKLFLTALVRSVTQERGDHQKQLLITLCPVLSVPMLSLPKSSTGEFHPSNVDGNLPQLKITGETRFPFGRRYDEEVGGVVCLSIYVQF
jgi:hypothetical protein